MKKVFILFSLFVACLSSCGQTDNEAVAALKQGIIENNKKLPMTAAFFTLERMEIKGNDYIVLATIDEEQMDFDQYMSNMNQSKSSLFSLAAGNNPDFAELFVKSGLNLKFSVSGNESKRQESLVLSADEIKKAYGSNDTNPRDFIIASVEQSADELPNDLGNGVSMTSNYIEGDYVCYKFKTDDSHTRISDLKKIKSEGNQMEESMIEEMMDSDDPGDVAFMRYLLKAGMGMKYIYWNGKAGEKVTFTITPEMIQAAFKERNN